MVDFVRPDHLYLVLVDDDHSYTVKVNQDGADTFIEVVELDRSELYNCPYDVTAHSAACYLAPVPDATTQILLDSVWCDEAEEEFFFKESPAPAEFPEPTHELVRVTLPALRYWSGVPP